MRRSLPLWLLPALLVAAPAARAQEPSFAKDVDQAVERGVDYLWKLQNKDGTWPYTSRGATLLATYTLLECGVSPNDERLRKSVNVLRDHMLTSNRTYEIALAIFLFDKLGDPADIPLIEALALELLAGQSPTYGWTYECPGMPPAVMKRVEKQIAKTIADGPRQLPEKPVQDKKPREPKQVDPAVMGLAQPLFRAPLPLPDAATWKQDFPDNSNTQFAMLALWVARRYGMPVDRALLGTEIRFRATQQKSGGWSYHSRSFDPQAPMPNQPTAAMTACGLIGLALGNACYPATMKKMDLNQDERVKAALYVLGAGLGEPGKKREELVLGNAGKSYYFLWTLERMAVIYGFQTIGGIDWYRWGGELLLANQRADGSWQGEFGAGGIDTCFALLFLKKANVAKDLTTKVGDKVKDPGRVPAELLDLIGRDVQPGVGGMPKKK